MARAGVAAMMVAALVAAAGGPPYEARAQEPPNPLLEWLNAVAGTNGAHVEVVGGTVHVDPVPDDPPVTDPVAELKQVQVYDLPMVPAWLSNCSAPWTICSDRGRAEPWDPAQPGLLILGEVGAPISALGAKEGHFGVFFALDEFPVQQTPDQAWTGYSHLVMARLSGEMRGAFEFGVAGASFEPYQTRGRVFVQDDQPYFGILVQTGTDLPRMPTAFTAYAFSSEVPRANDTTDVIGAVGGPPIPFATPGTLTFGEGVETAGPATAAPTQPAASTGAASTGAATPAGTPAATATPGGSPTGGGSLDTILLTIIFVLALILVLLGWWLFRGRGRSRPTTPIDPGPTRPARPGPPSAPPPGPGEGEGGPPGGLGGPVVGDPGKLPPPMPPPPPPPPRNCVEGDEEWRNDTIASSFLIAPADARVRLTTDPTTPELEGWMAQFGFPPGATAAGFGALDDAALEALLAGLPAGPTAYHWVFEFELHEYRLECQRKWRCENDMWVPTDETRLLESGPSPNAGRFAVDGPARTREDVRAAWLQVRAAVLGASAAEAAMDAYRKAC